MKNRIINALEVIFTSKLAKKLSIGIAICCMAYFIVSILISIIEKS